LPGVLLKGLVNAVEDGVVFVRDKTEPAASWLFIVELGVANREFSDRNGFQTTGKGLGWSCGSV